MPAWVDFAKGIFRAMEYENYLDSLDISTMQQGEWPMKFMEGSGSIKVDLARGLVLRRAESADAEQFATTDRYSSGELNINEFALDTSPQSVVRVPGGDVDGAESRLRSVSLFVAPAKEGAAAESPTRSAVTEGGGIEVMPSRSNDEKKLETKGDEPRAVDKLPDRPQSDVPPKAGDTAIKTPASNDVSVPKLGDSGSSDLPKADKKSSGGIDDGKAEDDPGIMEEDLW